MASIQQPQETESIFKKKTFWINLGLALAATAASYFSEVVPKEVVASSWITAVINWGLRLVTKTPAKVL